MPFAEAVLREVWRLHPIVPVVGRKAKRDAQLGGFLIKGGRNTFVALNHLQGTDPRWAGKVGCAAAAAARAGGHQDPVLTPGRPPPLQGAVPDGLQPGAVPDARGQGAGGPARVRRRRAAAARAHVRRPTRVQTRVRFCPSALPPGKRSCLGASLAMAEAKVFLASVARRLAFNVDPRSVELGGFPFPVVKMPTATVAAAPPLEG